jgi:cyclophilin family peptidyl-prolyl cis-trans isomerase
MKMKLYNNIIIKIVLLGGVLFSFSSFATTVQFETNLGSFEIDLYDEATPKSVENFLAYVNAKAYKNSVIHRSIKDFVIQGGGFSYEGEVPLTVISANNPVINEPVKSNLRGTIAYAKTANNPNSATTGWFINLGDNSENLDNQNGGFTVFGEVTGNGMTVVDKIATLPIFNGGGAFTTLPLQNFTAGNTPNDDNFVIVTSVKVIEVSIETKIQGLYIGYFNRAGDKEGLDYWKSRVATSTNSSLVLRELSAEFSKHPTFSATYADLSNKAFVEAIYRNVLGEAGDNDGINSWTGILDQGANRSDMVSDFIRASLEGDLTQLNLTPAELAIAEQRRDLLTNKVLVANSFTTLLGSKTNVENVSHPENDPAYLASIKVLSKITNDRSTASLEIEYLSSILSTNDPIAEINKATSRE